MFRRVAMTAFIIVVVTLSATSASAGVLTKFDTTRLTIEAHRDLKSFGITKKSIEDQVQAWVLTHLPNLTVSSTAGPFIHISVLLQEQKGYAYGYLGLRVVREVTINDLDLVVFGGIWQTGGVIISRVPETKQFVSQSLEQLLARFAEQWKRDNNG